MKVFSNFEKHVKPSKGGLIIVKKNQLEVLIRSESCNMRGTDEYQIREYRR